MKLPLSSGALRRNSFWLAGFAGIVAPMQAVCAAPTIANASTAKRGAAVPAPPRVPRLSLMSIAQHGSVIAAARVIDSDVDRRVNSSRRSTRNMTLPASLPPSTPIALRPSDRLEGKPIAHGNWTTSSPLTTSGDRNGIVRDDKSMTPTPLLNPKRGLSAKATSPNRKVVRRKGSSLASRSMSDRVLLARLEADLVGARRRLNNASVDLSHSERDLKRFTSTLSQAMLDAGPDARGLHPFVKVAQRYAGTPYVWGGESRNGFDCSGFIIIVMRDLGYRALPHSAAEQFTYGKPIAQALLKPGDLVFFANTYKPGISHVGIFLGRGRFIHAAGTGKGTIVSHLSASPYRQKYAGARRLVAGG